MSNMSYCKFHNTMMDLDNCMEALEYRDEMSEDEFRSCKKMFRRFIDFCLDEGIIEDDGELDDRLGEFFDSLNKE